MSGSMTIGSADTQHDTNEKRSNGSIRDWLEILSIPLLSIAGAILGGLTGFPPMSSIFALGLPAIAISFYLKRHKQTWGELFSRTRLKPAEIAVYTAVAVVLSLGAALLVTTFLQKILGFPPIDASRFVTLVEGNPVMYLWYLIPVAWGSAAIGEELVCRGFMLQRLTGIVGSWPAVVLQAGIFSLAHFYQGVTGVLAVFAFALVFGAICVRNGGNLLPVILAHGLIDTFAMTAIFLGRPDLLMGT